MKANDVSVFFMSINNKQRRSIDGKGTRIVSGLMLWVSGRNRTRFLVQIRAISTSTPFSHDAVNLKLFKTIT
jgi:hypothetical protein